ncbi:BZ3500_MvSof-1268-A1-R1_Chr4-2g07091 [Microbotryum saponariae]|uniref:BZ3500_MvSof-1268-A1-R1_Chr4-2g07091 protein n=1 Tax=Microbotryum saponariae TaxID=289078 RepID=A0A2X0MY78_9BASI|nr:BZ3500_MvSof-1268-A1-R1_Chr4-2g07091 [Microbotryum saponariae]SDA06756.1 BZ3501_MvSof-1269-A2-R1_Chr4-2g06802 [Microbotryum saponariae]
MGLDPTYPIASTSRHQPMASTSAKSSTTTTNPGPGTGGSHLRRVAITEQGLQKAAESVLKVLTHESMVQCFPEFLPVFVKTYGEEEGQVQFDRLVESLKEVLVEHYREGIPLAWTDMCERFDWIARANALDEIVERARQEKAQGRTPRNLYVKGTDGRLTIPSATVPVLKDATASLRARRVALEEKNQATYERIVQNQVVADRTEKQIKEIVEDFQRAVKMLSTVDMNELTELQKQVVQALPADAIVT